MSRDTEAAMIAWALVASADPARLATAAAAAWEHISDGGEPPPTQTRRLADGRAALVGDEVGLSGMFDRWAVAVARRLGVAVTAMDLEPGVDACCAATAAGRVATTAGATAAARDLGLVPRRAPGNRSMVIIDGATVEQATAALCPGLKVTTLPPTLSIGVHPRGVRVTATPPGMGPSVLARHLTGLGAVWTFVWGPTSLDLLVTWDHGARSGHARWPARPGKATSLPDEVADLGPDELQRRFDVADPAT